MRKVFVFLFVFIVLALILAPVTVARAEGPSATPTAAGDVAIPGSLSEFLTWVGTAGFFSVFLSLFLERLPGWDKEVWALPVFGQVRSTNWKLALSLIAAVIFGLFSMTTTKWIPGGIRPDANQLYTVVFNSVVIWATAQGFHWKFNEVPKLHTPPGSLG